MFRDQSMTTPEPRPDPPKPERRRFRYSLRPLFLLTLVVSIAVSLFAVIQRSLTPTMPVDEHRLQEANRQREAVKTIENLGGQVAYDFMFGYAMSADKRDEWDVSYADPPVPEWQLKQLGRDYFAYVEEVRLFGDEGTECLKDLPRLRLLELKGPKVTDTGLGRLAGLAQLHELHLESTVATDEAIETLQRALPDCKIVKQLSTKP